VFYLGIDEDMIQTIVTGHHIVKGDTDMGKGGFKVYNVDVRDKADGNRARGQNVEASGNT
jgi:hypothetical protein